MEKLGGDLKDVKDSKDSKDKESLVFFVVLVVLAVLYVPCFATCSRRIRSARSIVFRWVRNARAAMRRVNRPSSSVEDRKIRPSLPHPVDDLPD